MQACMAFRTISLLLLLSTAAAAAQDPRTAALDGYLGARAELGQLNGSVLVAEEGKVLIDGAWGLANFELAVPATPTTRYRVASVTKQFTAMAIMMLQEDGRLSVDDALSEHLPDLPESWAEITIHDLLRHTSGVSDYEEWFDGYATREYSDYMSLPDAPGRIVEDAKGKPLDFSPGSKFHYSNTGYILLGHVVETASGMSYEDFLQERIFEPLGMDRSGQDHSDRILPDRADGYTFQPGTFSGPYWNGLTAADFRNANYQYMSPPQGDAGLVTTTGDLFKWEQALYTNRLVPAEARETIFTPGLGGYGYGWSISSGDYGVVQRHSGGLPGFACEIIRFPGAGATIIVLTNVQSLPGWITRDLAAILFGEPYAIPARRNVVAYDEALHGGYVGMYATPDADSLRVYVDEIPLVEWSGHFTAALFPESGTQFYVGLIEGVARFEPRSDGSVELVIEDRFGDELVRAVRRERAPRVGQAAWRR